MKVNAKAIIPDGGRGGERGKAEEIHRMHYSCFDENNVKPEQNLITVIHWHQRKSADRRD